MWSDKELDEAFGRLAPPEPAPGPFPLDGWLRLETQLDKVAMERLFRRRLWRFFMAEMAVVAVAALVWLAWPAKPAATSAAPKGGVAKVATQGGSRGSARELSTAGQVNEHREVFRRAGSPAVAVATKPTDTATAAFEAATSASGNTLVASATSVMSNSPALVSFGKSQAVVTASGSSSDGAISTPGAALDSSAMPVAGNRRPLALASPSRYHSVTTGLKKPVLVAAGYVPTTKISSSSEGHRSIPQRPQHSASSASSKARRRTIATAKTAKARSGRPSSPLAAVSVTAATRTQLRLSSASTKNQYHNQDHKSIGNAAQASASINEAAATGAGPDNTSEITAAIAGLALLPVAVETDSADRLPAPLATLPLVPPTPLPEPLRQPRLYLGLVGAPDVSTVKMADFQAPTANFGVTLEYRIFDRLRVTTGFLRGTKNYRARRQDYDWSYYPIAANGNFEWVDGSCTIIDVPLNLRYDALVRPKYQLFGSAGLSSLFMQHETYAYDYSYYGRAYHWQRSFTNENQHWFSVLNLSAGYERNLSRHWRVQAEPYVKLPLGGVGAGKVRLASGGVFFGVKYGF